MKPIRWRLHGYAYAVALLVGCWQCTDAAYIHVKAALAQHLLARAWNATLLHGTSEKPWPWADTMPIARLRLARLGVEDIVLAGDSGRTLAFGPGWSESSAALGSSGTTVISAHRDTHFSFLRDVKFDDEVALETRVGQFRYRVTQMQIVDSRFTLLTPDETTSGLQLVTCYPFDAILPGGSLRYVITAVAIVN